MSDQGNSAPAPEAPAVSEAPITETPQTSEDSELEALEQELDGQEESSESNKSEQAPKEVKAADKAAKQEGAKKVSDDKYKIKVDGEEVELSREEMVKYAQLGRAGQKKMQEAAQVRQEAIKLVEMLRSNPRAVLSDPAVLGSDEAVLKFAQEILANKLEEDQKDPMVAKVEKLEKELEEHRKSKKDEDEKRQSEEYQRLVAQEEASLENQITEAFDTSGLPKSPFVLKRLADVMISGAELGKNVSPKMALNIVKKEMQRDLKEYFDITPEEALEEILNADKVKNLRKRQLSKLKEVAQKAAPSLNQISETAKPIEKTEETNPKIKLRDWLRSSK